jgi:hypothetical protein
VSTQIAAIGRVQAVGLDHHGHGVPAHVGAQALLDFKIARRAGFLPRFDGVDVPGVGRIRHVDAVLTAVFQQLFEQEVRPFRALALDHGRQGLHPFAGFLAVQVSGTTGILSVQRWHVCLL